MYMDTIVFAGVGTVGLMLVFMGGLYLVLKKQAEKKGK